MGWGGPGKQMCISSDKVGAVVKKFENSGVYDYSKVFLFTIHSLINQICL